MRRFKDISGRSRQVTTRPEKPGRRLFESLEARAMLAADPLAALADVSAQTEVTALASNGSTPVGYTPAQIAAAYGFNNISFSGVKGDGTGQTIAIVDAYDDPNIASDLAAFDSKFGLAAANFTKIEQDVNGRAPAEDAGWAMEISLDVEWAHAMAPGAKIDLIEANTSSLSNLLSSVQYAASLTNVSVVSMSWGTSEFSGETSYNSYFTTPSGHTGVSFVASSGDSGSGALWPAISTNVLAVGGTSLNLSGSTYSSETAWSGSGGGKSSYQGEASYQEGVQTSGAAEDPDVAFDANPNTGFAVYDSISDGGPAGWVEVGGTSAGSPQWAALVAIADQGRVKVGENTLTSAAAAVYSLPSSDFHDVTSGSNGGFSATKGYDEVTGLGSPQANLVAQGLVGVTTAQQSFTTATISTPTRFGFFFGPGGGSRRFDDVDVSESSSLLFAGVTFNQAATNNASSINATAVGSTTTVGSSLASASSVTTSWVTSDSVNQTTSSFAIVAASTANDDSAADESGLAATAGARIDAVVARQEAETMRWTSASDRFSLRSTDDQDTTTRNLVESLDSLFGGNTDWAYTAAGEFDAESFTPAEERRHFGGDAADTPSAAALVAGLAISALWSESRRNEGEERLEETVRRANRQRCG
jgi:subtilase family serine protease